MSETQARPKPGERSVVNRAPSATGTDTVTIGLKWPNGLIMRIYDAVEEEYILNNRTIKENRFFPKEDCPEYHLNGFSIDLGAMAGGIPPDHEIVGGFGLTHGIPRDFAEAWFAQNDKSDLVKKGLVFMAGREQMARGQAKEHASLKCGIEPLDPNNPAPRAGLRPGTIQKDQATG
jgi:hypothetical protein